MSRKPFTVSAPAAPSAPNKALKVSPVVDRSAPWDKASEDGITLLEAGAELMLPDGEAGPLEEAAVDPGGRPVYGPSIPWPGAKSGHKPYKI